MATPLFGFGYYRPPNRILNEAEERRLKILYEQRSQLMKQEADYMAGLRASLEEEKAGRFDREAASLKALTDVYESLSNIQASRVAGSDAAATRASEGLGVALINATKDLDELGHDEVFMLEVGKRSRDASKLNQDVPSAVWDWAAKQEMQNPGTIDAGTYFKLVDAYGSHEGVPGIAAGGLAALDSAKNNGELDVASRKERTEAMKDLADRYLRVGSGSDTEDLDALEGAIGDELGNLKLQVAAMRADTTHEMQLAIYGTEGEIRDPSLARIDDALKATQQDIQDFSGNSLQVKYDEMVARPEFKAFAEEHGIDTTTSRGEAMAVKMLVRTSRRSATPLGRSRQNFVDSVTTRPVKRTMDEARARRAARDPMSERTVGQDMAAKMKERIAKRTAPAERSTAIDTDAEDAELSDMEAGKTVAQRAAITAAETGLPEVDKSKPLEASSLDVGSWADDIDIEGRLNEEFEDEMKKGDPTGPDFDFGDDDDPKQGASLMKKKRKKKGGRDAVTV
tara:strand:- start:1487 stop:3019 length:1533 start_codon:yes stop_codon:yes gene_type:complete